MPIITYEEKDLLLESCLGISVSELAYFNYVNFNDHPCMVSYYYSDSAVTLSTSHMTLFVMCEYKKNREKIIQITTVTK